MIRSCLLIPALLACVCTQGLALDREITIGYQSDLLATKAGAEITHLDFDSRLESIPPENRGRLLSDPKSLEQLIDTMLSMQFFSDRAVEAGMLDDPMIQARLFRRLNEELADLFLEREIDAALLDDYTNQAREAYLTNPERFKSEESVSFSHVLINHESNGAEQQARDLLTRILQGESIEALAVEYSEDPSVAQNQGRFDNIPPHVLDPMFRDGLLQTEVGTTEVIESSFGWHVITLNAYEPGTQLTFEDVAEDLKQQARAAHREEISQRYLRQLYSESLVIEEGAVTELLDRHSANFGE